jgi:AraC-like DNA-binding protein
MQVHFFPVPDALAPYVRHIFAVESESAVSLPFFADGMPGLVFHLSEGHLSARSHGRLAPAFLYGQTLSPIELQTEGRTHLMFVMLQPHALGSLFGIRADELTDSCTGLHGLPHPAARDLSRRLPESGTLHCQTEQIGRWLHLQAHSRPAADAATSYAIEQLAASEGRASIRDIRRRVQLTERSLERRFAQHVGVSPRMFARICRFRAAYRQLRHRGFGELTALAYDLDFADQSHLIRTIRQFTGMSPMQLQKQTGLTV